MFIFGHLSEALIMESNMKLINFEQTLKATHSISQLNQVLGQYLTSYGIKTFAYTYYSYHPTSQNKLKYDFATPNFLRWHKHYIEEGYEDVDSTLESVYQTVLPTFWDLQQQLKDAKSPREKQMRLDSIEFGAQKGLSIPIYGPNEDFAILLLVQMRGENCLNNSQELQFEFFAAAYYYYFYMQKELLRSQPPAEKYQLSKRELQCLTLIAKKYSIEAMAKSLNLTERTINYHIQRLNKKLGAKNKYQSVMKALQEGLIKL